MRAAKVDANHKEIVKALRHMGCSVVSLAAVGKGVPDLLVGVRGYNLLLEVKDRQQPPSKRKLNKAQQEWHEAWRGHVETVDSPMDAILAVRGCMMDYETRITISDEE